MKKINNIKSNKKKVTRSANSLLESNSLSLLQKSFKAFLDITQVAYILYNKNLKAITCNKTFSQSIKEITGKLPADNFNLLDMVNPEKREKFRNNMCEALKGKLFEYDTMYDAPQPRWLHLNIFPVKNHLDQIIGICISLKDITQKKNDQEDLKYQATLLHNIEDAVVSTDLDFRIKKINKAAEKIYGVKASEVLGKHHHAVFLFEFIRTTKKQVFNRIQTTGKWSGEATYTRRDGRKILISASVNSVYDDQGTKIGYVGVDRDITKQRQVEEKARQTEHYKNALMESTPEALFLLNANYDIITLNPRAYIILEKFLHVKVKTGMNLINILPEFRKEDTRQKLAYANLGNSIEYEVQYPGGLWLLVSISPVKDHEKNITELCVGLRDITRRKKVEIEIRKNDQQYRSLVDSLSEGVIFQSFDKRIITFNDSAIAILDVKREDLQRYGFPLPGCTAINEKSEKLDIKEMIRNRVFEGIPVKGLIAGIISPAGLKWLSINIEPVVNEDGLAYAYVITFIDITISFKIKEELNLLSKVVKETSNIVVITDEQEKIIWANNAFTKISEYTLEEALNKKPGWLLKGPEKDNNEVKKIKEAVKKGIAVEGDILNYTKTGRQYWSHYNIHPVKDENGNLIKYFSIQTDITESRKLHEKISKQKELIQKERNRAIIKGQEKERNEVGQELHDNIQQILGGAKLQLSCVRNIDADNSAYIQSASDCINLSIEEIRRFSKRLVAPRFKDSSLLDEIEYQACNLGLSELISIETKSFEEEILSDDIKLTLFRIVQEQLNNIIKHAKATDVLIRLENNNKNVYLTINDNGAGFDPLKKRNGIGFNNIQNRVEQFNGSAKLQSAPGKGCELVVSIPVETRNYQLS